MPEGEEEAARGAGSSGAAAVGAADGAPAAPSEAGQPEQAPETDPLEREDQDLYWVVRALESQDELQAKAKTMFKKVLPLAAKGGSTIHRYQQEFVELAATALDDFMTSARSEIASLEGQQLAAEEDLKGKVAQEKDVRENLQEVAGVLAGLQEIASEKTSVLKLAEGDHREMLERNGAFLQSRAHESSERTRIAAVVRGPLQMLMEGGWVDGEEAKVDDAVAAVEGLLSEIYADRAVIAAAHYALGLKPESRRPFDTITVEAVAKVLPKHLEGLNERFSEFAPQERRKKSEVLGLWAIADCARDEANVANANFAKQKETHYRIDAELEGIKKGIFRHNHEFAERGAKRRRLGEQLVQHGEASEAMARLRAR